MPRLLAPLVALLCLALAAPGVRADARTELRLNDSRAVFESFTFLTEQSIPGWLMERAYGIVVVPDLVKGALVIGGRGGRGVMSVRNPDGSWSYPVFVTLGGANFGFQAGVQRTDVVMVLMSRRSVEGIAGGKVTLGADASVAAGPIGRAAGAATDAMLKAQVLTYSRNEGVFAGVALDGTWISIDDRSNAAAYGVAGILPSQILEGRVAAPPAAQAFTAVLAKATSGAATVPAASAPAAAPAATAPAAGKPDPDAATTFPLEDPAPGAPPPE
jgi:lipid-binding SYLF domain-containing protein